MIGSLTLLLAYQLIGEIIARGFRLPVPGPVIGMLLLFLALLVRGRVSDKLRSTAGGLLQHLSLLFVPAGTGVMLHVQRIADEWLPLLAAVIGSTFLAMTVSALVLRALDSHNRVQRPE